MLPLSLRAVLRPRLSLASSGSHEIDENVDGVTEVYGVQRQGMWHVREQWQTWLGAAHGAGVERLEGVARGAEGKLWRPC
ncbi:hypothetical protein E1A91_D13G091800v1 [Gossypium mustelinum]|uniref:Uncharacterized protein n=1 Tax=Gossypium mustelinum TaxID=34275 RepID=A0A5D2S0L1_GOSMU|nr:hypothetical protein E1A91_D13G091800v1 [Gossypium mustelinum]